MCGFISRATRVAVHRLDILVEVWAGKERVSSHLRIHQVRIRTKTKQNDRPEIVSVGGTTVPPPPFSLTFPYFHHVLALFHRRLPAL